MNTKICVSILLFIMCVGQLKAQVNLPINKDNKIEYSGRVEVPGKSAYDIFKVAYDWYKTTLGPFDKRFGKNDATTAGTEVAGILAIDAGDTYVLNGGYIAFEVSIKIENGAYQYSITSFTHANPKYANHVADGGRLEKEKSGTMNLPLKAWNTIKETTDLGVKTMLSDLETKVKAIADQPVSQNTLPALRKVRWGDSKMQVMKSEDGEPSATDNDILKYSTIVQNLKCDLYYEFMDDKLVRASYIFTQDHANKNDYIADYKSVKETLIQKYGTPFTDKTVWKDDLYKNDTQEYGMAVAAGHLVYLASWVKPESGINLFLNGDNYKLMLRLQYTSMDFKEKVEQVKQVKNLNDF
jgi:hypothetical protein